MKISLTFQPFVKPLYKKYCIEKVQQTVNSIKSHLIFSKKQNIYQHHLLSTQKQHQKNQEQNIRKSLDKTIKKQSKFYSNIHQNEVRNYQNQQSKSFSLQQIHLTQQKINESPQLLQNLQNSKQEKQKKELIQFLNKVEATLNYHSNFYQNMMQKINLMAKKQVYLQRFINESKNLTSQQTQKQMHKISSQINKKPKKTLDKNQQTIPLYSITFRRNQSLNSQQTDRKTKIINKNSTEVVKQNILKDLSNPNLKQKQQLYAYLINDKQNQQANSEQIKTASKNDSLNYNQTLNNFIQENTFQNNSISQNADFLINFMRLQQQFNKIKKKTKFQNNLASQVVSSRN